MKKSHGCQNWWSLKNRFYAMPIFPILIFSLFILGLLTRVCSSHHDSASAEVLEVDDSGSKEYSFIQDAVENATDGDTILVYPGSYYENIQINKTINITGVDREKTVLIPSLMSTILVNGENCFFSNLTFDGNQLGSGGKKQGMYIFANHTRIFNCTFRYFYHGLMVSSSVNTSVNFCRFIGNTNGISFRSGSVIRVNDCEFDSNHDGVEMENSHDIRIEDCKFGNSESCGIRLTNASNDLKVRRCSFRDGSWGLFIGRREYTEIGNGIVTHCSFLGNNIGVKIAGGSHSVRNCRLNASHTGVYIQGDGNEVYECTISNSSSSGIYLYGEGNSITWNTIENSGKYGILVGDRLKYDNNYMMNNTFRNNSKGDIGEEYPSYGSGLPGVDVMMAVVAGFVVVGWKRKRKLICKDRPLLNDITELNNHVQNTRS